MPHPIEGDRLWKSLLGPAAIAISASNLLFLNTWHEIFPGAEDQYVKGIAITPVTLVALWTNLVAVSAGLLALYLCLRKSRFFNQAALFASLLLAASLLQPSLRILVQFSQFFNPNHIRKHFSPLLISGCISGGVVGMALLMVLKPEKVLRSARTILLALSPAPFLLSFAYLRAIPPPERINHAGPPPISNANVPERQLKAVVLIFDEWDFEYAFSKRPAWIQLPAIDQFAREYGSYASCWPPSGQTIRSIPSLATGRYWLGAVPGPNGELLLKDPNSKKWTSWNDTSDLFLHLSNLGWQTKMVQWLHQFPPTYLKRRPGLAVSHHSDFPKWNNANEAYQSYRSSLGRCWTRVFDSFRVYLRVQTRTNPIPARVDMAEEMIGELVSTVKAKRTDLLWAHLPFPHPPAILDARSGAFLSEPSPKTSNLDNMVLVDRTLSLVRTQMESQGDWDGALILLTSDHWQRENTAENIPTNPEKYSNEKGYRVPLLVKWPHQSAHWVDNEPVDNISIRAMVEAISSSGSGGYPFPMAPPPVGGRSFLLKNETH